MADGSATIDVSPYARAFAQLEALGYHAIPLSPPGADCGGAGKAPGLYMGARWRGLSDWQRFRDQQPTSSQSSLWARWPASNIGIVLGSSAGVGEHLIAVDIDAKDYDVFQTIAGALPNSPMVKRGAKGETRFYRAAATIRTASFDDTRDVRTRLADLLTGFDTRQTVVPPSVHPEGPVYVWTAGPVAPAELPLFGLTDLERFQDTLRSVGWNADFHAPGREVRGAAAPADPDNYWTAIKAAALLDLDRWVPALELHGCRRARGGYEAVATWRGSSTGQPLEKRKRNLSIQRNGIVDFGTSEKFTAIDLVMRAHGCDQPDATTWLRDRLGIDEHGDVVIDLQPRAADAVTAPETAPTPTPAAQELPDHLTRPPGLLGEITDWICATARRPQRALALGAALTLVGTAAGRRYAGPTRTGTHLYVLGLARTGAGKDHAGKRIAQVLNACGMERHLGPSQFMSLSSVVNRMIREPLTLSAIDEFGSFLARVNNKRGTSHEQAISGVLRQMWSHNFETYMPPEWAQRAAEPIHTPALSIYGVAVPDEFYAALSGADVHNGFLNRFLLFATRDRPYDREPKADVADVPDSIKQGMAAIYGSTSVLAMATAHNGHSDAPTYVARWGGDEPAQVYRDFGRYIEDREGDAAFLARAHEMSVRLATIRAVGVSPTNPVVTQADMEWGRDVALWAGERMIAEVSDHMAENETHANSQRVARLVRETGSIRHGDLVRKMQMVRARDLKDIIAGLIDSGVIVADSEATATKPVRIYRVV